MTRVRVIRTTRSSAGANFVERVLDRIFETLPRAGVAFFPARSGVGFDNVPVTRVVRAIARQVVTVSIRRRHLLVLILIGELRLPEVLAEVVVEFLEATNARLATRVMLAKMLDLHVAAAHVVANRLGALLDRKSVV